MILVVTGGIGSGKSTVCRILNEDYHWPVYSADDRVKDMYVSNPEMLFRIETQLGECFRDETGSFIPSKLSRRIFSDKDALDKVEGIVFPCLIEDFMRWKNEHTDKSHLILESATILLKPQLRSIVDKVVFVEAPMELRCERVMTRSGLSQDEILKRMENQGAVNDGAHGILEPYIDFHIINDSSSDVLYQRVSDLVKKLR